MKIKQFNGERLREGRIYRGLSITDIANELNISKQMVSKYENNKSAPPFEAVLKLIKILNFPKDYFYEKGIEVKTGNAYFKSLLTTSKKDRDMQNDRIKYLTVIRYMMEEYLEFPDINLPHIQEDGLNDIEKISLLVREHWGLGESPIKNMVLLLEENGFVVTSLKTGIKKIDAFGSSQDIGGRNFYTIVLGNDKKSFYRRQFTTAHELAHKVLHDPELNTNEITKDEFKKIEEQANEFASAFLLPKNAFSKDVLLHPTDLDYYKHLKKKWCTSISAMVVRAHRLKIISTSQYTYLQRQISRRNWRTLEPFDDTKELQDPVAIRQAVEILIENEILTGREFVEKLSKDYGLSLLREEIEQLLGLDYGYLKTEDQESRIISINDLRNRK